jgi:hypothetical protein
VAKFTGTYNTYQTVGIKEDVSEAIYNISPKSTPFMTASGQDTAGQSLFEWQVDSLATPDGNNAQLEGDDLIAVDTSTPTTRLGNYCQISRKSAAVSGTNEASEKYGRGSDLAYNMAKKSAELKRDVETILLQNQAANAGADGVARKTGSVLAFIKTNTNFGAGGANPTYTNVPTATRTDGTLRNFTEVILTDVLQQMYISGAEPQSVMLGAALKHVASSFTGVATKTFYKSAVEATAIIGAADIYVGEFTTIAIVPNRWMRVRDALFIDKDYVAVAYLRPFFTKPLAVTGDAEKRLILGEYGLKVKNEKALGLATDLQ